MALEGSNSSPDNLKKKKKANQKIQAGKGTGWSRSRSASCAYSTRLLEV
jgi:hypothetical protein